MAAAKGVRCKRSSRDGSLDPLVVGASPLFFFIDVFDSWPSIVPSSANRFDVHRCISCYTWRVHHHSPAPEKFSHVASEARMSLGSCRGEYVKSHPAFKLRSERLTFRISHQSSPEGQDVIPNLFGGHLKGI